VARVTINDLKEQIQSKNEKIEKLNKTLLELKNMCKILVEHKNDEIQKLLNRIKELENADQTSNKTIDIHKEDGSIIKSNLTNEQIEKAIVLRKSGLSYGKIATQISVNKSAAYNLLKSRNL
jgi:TolA-binding protein